MNAPRYTARPDYLGFRTMFAQLRAEIGPEEDHGFDFLKGRDTGGLEPLQIDAAWQMTHVNRLKKTLGPFCMHIFMYIIYIGT